MEQRHRKKKGPGEGASCVSDDGNLPKPREFGPDFGLEARIIGSRVRPALRLVRFLEPERIAVFKIEDVWIEAIGDCGLYPFPGRSLFPFLC